MRGALAVLLVLAAWVFTGDAFAWSDGHATITRAAFESLPQAQQAGWGREADDPIWKCSRKIAEGLIKDYCYIPDLYDCGPKNPTFKPEVKPFFRSSAQGKSYHYFTLDEKGNREWCRAGAQWYFEQMARAFKANKPVDAAMYAGSFAHAIEDRTSPYHCLDGYEKARADYEKQHGLDFKFWALSDKHVAVSLEGRMPILLGKDPAEAARAFCKRFEENNAYARGRIPDFVGAHLKDDWKNEAVGSPTDAIMSEMATEAAKLVADVFYTALVTGSRTPAGSQAGATREGAR